MLASTPSENTSPMTVDHQMAAPAPPLASVPRTEAQALEDMYNYLASPEFKDNPIFSSNFDMNEYLTSPLPDLMDDFDSPEETPSNDFLTTPLIRSEDNFLTFPSDFETMPLFPDPVQEPSKPAQPAEPQLDMEGLFTLSPSTPSIDTPGLDPSSLYPTPRLPTALSNIPLDEPTRTASGSRRRTTATGTRKGITPESLVPLDAPTQPRKYATPSATSRKELPAVFARKRARSQAFGDEEDELEGEQAPGPNATEKEQIEWKRRQNTLAARKSRKRKLQHQQELEDTVRGLTREREVWKTRALTFRQLLVSHGIPFSEFQD